MKDNADDWPASMQIGSKSTGETIAYYYKWKKLENSKYRHLLAHQRRGGSVVLDRTIYPHGDELDIDAEADLNSKVCTPRFGLMRQAGVPWCADVG